MQGDFLTWQQQFNNKSTFSFLGLDWVEKCFKNMTWVMWIYEERISGMKCNCDYKHTIVRRLVKCMVRSCDCLKWKVNGMKKWISTPIQHGVVVVRLWGACKAVRGGAIGSADGGLLVALMTVPENSTEQYKSQYWRIVECKNLTEGTEHKTHVSLRHTGTTQSTYNYSDHVAKIVVYSHQELLTSHKINEMWVWQIV